MQRRPERRLDPGDDRPGGNLTIAGPQGCGRSPLSGSVPVPGRRPGAGRTACLRSFPAAAAHSGARYLRFIPRNEMDIAVVGVGARVDLSDDLQKIVSARIALGAVAPTPILVPEASDFLVGKGPIRDGLQPGFGPRPGGSPPDHRHARNDRLPPTPGGHPHQTGTAGRSR